MKKIFTLLMIIGFVNMNFMPVMAMEFMDVSKDHWAYKEIDRVVKDDVMQPYSDGSFHPTGLVTRGEFVDMLVRALNQQKLVIKTENPFSDINEETKYFDQILRGIQLDLIKGFPEDGTYKPDMYILKEHVTAIAANTLDVGVKDVNVLENYLDNSEISNWAKIGIVRAVENNLCVNYPDPMALTPRKKVTRAEVAVLLARLRAKYDLISKKKKNILENIMPKKAVVAPIVMAKPKIKTKKEHLPMLEGAVSDVVYITGKNATIVSGNVVPASFAKKFTTRRASVGDKIAFAIPNDVKTKEGTVLFPAGSYLKGEVTQLQKRRFFNRDASVNFNVQEVVLTNGSKYAVDADCYYEGDKQITLSGILKGAIVGTAIGVFGGAASDEKLEGAGAGFLVGSAIATAAHYLGRGESVTKRKGEMVLVNFKKPVKFKLVQEKI